VKRRSSLALVAGAALLAASRADAATLTVDIVGAEPPIGQLIVSVYGSEETFLKSSVASKNAPVLPTGSARIVFADLPSGEYAIAVTHDENGDGALDRVSGVATEAYGFSNNARGRSGPPAWSLVRFTISAETSVLVAVARDKP
jgi:uncharacterized protein (DUF2141 family)